MPDIYRAQAAPIGPTMAEDNQIRSIHLEEATMNIAGRIIRSSLLGWHARLCLSAVLGMTTLPLAALSAPGGGDYTREQAQVGPRQDRTGRGRSG
jgi:hypothetical protein